MATKVIAGERLPVGTGGDVISLQGPSGQVVELAGDGANTLQWAPIERRAMEVELMIRLLAHTNPAGINNDPPILRASVQYGHGVLTWQDPFMPPPFASGALVYENYGVPARGIVWRLAAREIKVVLRSSGRKSGGAAYPKTSVYVSFLPCDGMVRPVWPQNDFAVTSLVPLVIAPFPVGATQWRIFDQNGAAFAAGNVSYVGLESETYTVTRASLADFRPIAYDAVGYVANVPIYAEFR